MSLEALLKLKVVSAARHEQRVIESPRSVSVLTSEEIRKRNYRTVPEALNEMMGILVQETNYGGGAPIIRGMIGNRILILVDGIRLNNSVYRLGPLQYLNTIDLYRVERIEVVRGPSSALYGSDALGGLINIVTRSPETGRAARRSIRRCTLGCRAPTGARPGIWASTGTRAVSDSRAASARSATAICGAETAPARNPPAATRRPTAT